jgi:hypothetical protein
MRSLKLLGTDEEGERFANRELQDFMNIFRGSGFGTEL